ncbi:MAG: hypothetical protein V4531_12275 [Actinomycetota bacterium]
MVNESAEQSPESTDASPTVTQPVTADPSPANVPAQAPPRSGVRRWILPGLALLAVAVIALLGGILIGQRTGDAGSPAGFNRPGIHDGPGKQDPRGHGSSNGSPRDGGSGQTAPRQQGDGVRPGGVGGAAAGTIQSIDADTLTTPLFGARVGPNG